MSIESNLSFKHPYSCFNNIADLLEEEYEKRITKVEPEEITDSNTGNLQFDY
jgi:hypothetical protein